MSINVKKYTKNQMAKMVEEAKERLESLKSENADLIEKLRKETAERIALRNDLMAKAHSVEELKADLDASKAASKILNDQGQDYWRAWQASKKDVTGLRNKLAELEKELSEHRAATVRRLDELKKQLADTEAALGRANAEVSRVTVGCRQVEEERDFMHQQWSNAEQRAHYAEARPWRNLWAWVKRKLGGEGNKHVS